MNTQIVHIFARLIALVGIALLSTRSATAVPISIDFNIGASPNASGEPVNSAGLILPGQVGDWESLVVGGSEVSTTVGGATFTLNPGYLVFNGTGSNTGDNGLRGDVVYLTGSQAPVTWTLSGLTPSAQYDLILFSQMHSNNPVNAADFEILGHDAGNGTGAAVTLDSEFDGNFTNVIADGSGVITGTLSKQIGQSFSGWSGIQFEQVPEPSSIILAVIGMLGVGTRRHRKRRNVLA